MRHPPHIDRPGKAEYANMNGRGVRAPGIGAPVPAAAEDGQSADIDVDTFRHVDIDVPERRQNRHRRPLPIDGGVAQIEVKVSEGTAGQGRLRSLSRPRRATWPSTATVKRAALRRERWLG